MENVTIRAVTPKDAAALLAIYAPYVENTCISYEYVPPTAEEFAGRITRTLEKYPYLAAESDGELLGYVYAGPLHPRAAYDWAVETSIYVREDKKGLGLGRLLYQALEQALGEQGILNMNACIAYPPVEDEYLTRSSADFHEHMGFHLVGRFQQCSYKFGRWYDMIWMEKHIGDHLPAQPPVKPFPAVRDTLREKYGIL
ncbi:MAG: N-acetyltransferase family protein [Oscillospiraceae bacterium]|nr:N-acetyltransferase family protein [Oscillospiraceae bacterium]